MLCPGAIALTLLGGGGGQPVRLKHKKHLRFGSIKAAASSASRLRLADSLAIINNNNVIK